MTTSEMIISAAITGAIGVVVWIIKDKQKSDLDYFKDLVKALKDDIKEANDNNKQLNETIKTEQAEKKAETKLKDDCLKRVHELEIQDQKKENELTLLRAKKNAPGNSGDTTNNYY